MLNNFHTQGFSLLRNFLTAGELAELNQVLRAFHRAWLEDNAEAYQRGAINSAYLTGARYLNSRARQTLWGFLASNQLMAQVAQVFSEPACFMNTQLFFDPFNPEQKNYWHRDFQYHLNLVEQQQALAGPQVIHFRIPMVPERGIELVPSSHKRWDTAEELDVRLEHNGRRCFDPLSNATTLALNAGDLLIFSAACIHRGLYGLNRLALDILFCDPAPELLRHINADCLPTAADMASMQNPAAFLRASNCVVSGK